MQSEQFNEIVESMIKRTHDLLVSKNSAYNEGGDKLASFKKAAALQGVTPLEALRGMWVKHVVSISDMLGDKNVEDFHIDVWEEKLGDNINYSLLALALVHENDSPQV